MGFQHLWRRATLRLLAGLVVAVTLLPGLAMADDGGRYQVTNLVSDQPGVAMFQDTHLVNAWGMSRGPTTPWWVSDNGSGVSTLYGGNGVARSLVVTIPTPPGGAPQSTPTGQVFNEVASTRPTEFVVSGSIGSGPSRFIFATEDGTISGWTPAADGTDAILAVDRSQSGAGAIYKGLAMGQSGGNDFLYATNFRFGTVEMFDAQFKLAGSFTDPMLADMCAGTGKCFAPFGIQNIGGQLYVTFALQSADKVDDISGPANGFVDVFDTAGNLLRRFASHGRLNSPWGLALAPADFGRFGGDLLVGNFGDGRINAYDVITGEFQGQLRDQSNRPITIDGLWGLGFGGGAVNNPNGLANELFFTAGPNGEQNGLFGKIAP